MRKSCARTIWETHVRVNKMRCPVCGRTDSHAHRGSEVVEIKDFPFGMSVDKVFTDELTSFHSGTKATVTNA